MAEPLNRIVAPPLPRQVVPAGYDWSQSYDWNYKHVPGPAPEDEPVVPGQWDLCGLPAPSPLGIAAGPLLNGQWILYYAALGFDVLTYKTVRSRARACYAMPNLQPVTATRVQGGKEPLTAAAEMEGSWAVSFGMPSRSPDVWRADVEKTRRLLPKNKLLSVSVVATPEEGWSLEELAEDFAQCARWATESGADCVEANFSCPNVASADGQLFHRPEAAALVAARVRAAIGNKPLLIKIGHVTAEPLATALIRALTPTVDALVMVNCISAQVRDEHAKPLFDGQTRGIAGDAIAESAVEQVRLFSSIIRQQESGLRLVGVGGIATAAQVQAHLQAGAHAVQLATSAMLHPQVGLQIRRDLASAQS